MRFLTLIIAVLFVPKLYAGEEWFMGVTAEQVGVAAVARDFEDSTPRIVEGQPIAQPSFTIYFQPKYMCYPVFLIMTDEETTALQLRVDHREVYRPLMVKWNERFRATRFVFDAPSMERAAEQMELLLALLRDLEEGNNLRAKLEPSGQVMRWSLRGSSKAIQWAQRRCREGAEDQQFFTE